MCDYRDHTCHALKFAGSQGSCLNPMPLGSLEFKHLPRDPANINAMKETCLVIV